MPELGGVCVKPDGQVRQFKEITASVAALHGKVCAGRGCWSSWPRCRACRRLGSSFEKIRTRKYRNNGTSTSLCDRRQGANGSSTGSSNMVGGGREGAWKQFKVTERTAILAQSPEIYRIFRTISRTFFHSLAGPATYNQGQLIYQKIYHLTLSHVSFWKYSQLPHSVSFFCA